MRSRTYHSSAFFSARQRRNHVVVLMIAVVNDLLSCVRLFKSPHRREEQDGRSLPFGNGDRLYAMRMAILHLHEGMSVLMGQEFHEFFESRKARLEESVYEDVRAIKSTLNRANKKFLPMLRLLRNSAGGHYGEMTAALEAGVLDHGLLEFREGPREEGHWSLVDRVWYALLLKEMKVTFPAASDEESFACAIRAIVDVSSSSIGWE